MTARACPASGKRCACAPGSIRARECEHVALDIVDRIAQLAAPTQGLVQAANGFQRRAKEAAA